MRSRVRRSSPADVSWSMRAGSSRPSGSLAYHGRCQRNRDHRPAQRLSVPRLNALQGTWRWPSPIKATRPASTPPAPPAQLSWLGSICPYLRAEDGTWRSAVPTRDHRCWAVTPASPLPTATQQELCLTAAHGGCERFLHSRDQRAAALAQDHIEVGRLESARFGPVRQPCAGRRGCASARRRPRPAGRVWPAQGAGSAHRRRRHPRWHRRRWPPSWVAAGRRASP